jgi:DNA mismatch repair protein MSH4
MQAETRYENARHYYLRLYESDFNGREVPEVLVNRYQKKDSHNEIVLMSDKTVQELIENLRGEIPSLYQVCESIALLDMLAAFGHAATSSVSDYSRPDLTDCIGIKSGRHPVREKVCRLCMIGVFLLIISCFRCTSRNSYPMTFMRPSNLASRSSLAVT